MFDLEQDRIDEFDYSKPLEGQKKNENHWRKHSMISVNHETGKVKIIANKLNAKNNTTTSQLTCTQRHGCAQSSLLVSPRAGIFIQFKSIQRIFIELISTHKSSAFSTNC